MISPAFGDIIAQYFCACKVNSQYFCAFQENAGNTSGFLSVVI
jgi:hypothetical protein